MLRSLLAVPAVIGILFCAALFAVSAMSTLMARRAASNWRATLEAAGEARERLEDRPAGETSARRVEQLAAGLGFDLAPRSVPRGPRDLAAERLARGAAEERRAWVRGIAARPERGPLRPPPAVEAWLCEHAGKLEALRETLAHGPPPLWSRETLAWLDRPPYGPGGDSRLPNVLGHLAVQDALAADALWQAAQGRPALAQDALEASWRLAAEQRDHPVLIVQLVATGVARQQAGLLRQLGDPGGRWRDRLDGRRARRRLIDALAFEGFSWLGYADFESEDAKWLVRITQPLARPVVRYSLASASVELHDRVERLAGLAAWCDRDLEALGASLELELPGWNKIGQLAVGSFGGVVERVARLELELELTSLVLELDDAGGRALEATRRSRACPGEAWSVTRSPDGSLEIAFTREPRWKNDLPGGTPLRFVR